MGGVGGLQHGAVSTTQTGPGTFGADPNQLVNAYGRFPTDSTHSFRASSTIELPWELQFAIREVYESGRPYGRTDHGARPEPGQRDRHRAAARRRSSCRRATTSAIRIGKDLTMSAGQLLRLSLDIQNLFNNDTPLSIDDQQFAGHATARRRASRLPRRALVGIRYQLSDVTDRPRRDAEAGIAAT